MAKEMMRYCPCCAEEITVRLGLLYSDSYCCNCGTTVRSRRTITGKQIYLAYPRSNDGTYIRIECKGGKKDGNGKMPEVW